MLVKTIQISILSVAMVALSQVAVAQDVDPAVWEALRRMQGAHEFDPNKRGPCGWASGAMRAKCIEAFLDDFPSGTTERVLGSDNSGRFMITIDILPTFCFATLDRLGRGEVSCTMGDDARTEYVLGSAYIRKEGSTYMLTMFGDKLATGGTTKTGLFDWALTSNNGWVYSAYGKSPAQSCEQMAVEDDPYGQEGVWTRANGNDFQDGTTLAGGDWEADDRPGQPMGSQMFQEGDCTAHVFRCTSDPADPCNADDVSGDLSGLCRADCENMGDRPALRPAKWSLQGDFTSWPDDNGDSVTFSGTFQDLPGTPATASITIERID